MNEAYMGAAVVERIEAGFVELARDANEASAAARNAWVFFIALNVYFFTALATVTHRELLLGAPVRLPLLGVDISLSALFVFAPLILLLIHFGILLQHAMLARKVLDLHSRLTRFEGPENYRTHRTRIQLHSYFYTQLLAGPFRSKLFAGFLSVMTWGSLVIVPIVLLLDFQVTFLPYHDITVTWTHRLYLVVDLVFIAIFGVYMRYPSLSFVRGFGANIARRTLSFVVSALLFLTAMFFAFAVATLPDETMDRVMSAIPLTRVPVPLGQSNGQRMRTAFLPTALLFDGAVDPVSGRATSLFSRNLVVTDTDLVRDGDSGAGETSLNLRRRDLRYATFDRSDLHRSDLTGATLTKASLHEANLSGAKVERAVFQDADLRRADLKLARLRGADLAGALLEGADLKDAQLDAEDIVEALMQDAKF